VSACSRTSNRDTPVMDEALAARSARFAVLPDDWSGDDPEVLASPITQDHVGHPLHLREGERTAEQDAAWIQAYRGCTRGADSWS